MNKISFRPLWSLDIIKTENYLYQMGEKGYELNSINFPLKIFEFKKVESKSKVFRITYSKDFGNKLSTNLINDGWESVLENKKWRVLSNEKEISYVKNFPTRDGILKRNKNILEVDLSVILILLTISIPNVITLGPIVDKSIIIYLISIIISLVSIFKIKSGNRKLIGENSKKEIGGKFNNRNKIKKIKFGWFCEVDNIEKWLEKMESIGYTLSKVELNSFYFRKGEKKRVKYFIEFQKFPSEDYNNMYSSLGWKSVNASYLINKRWSFWKKEYEGEIPEIFTDKKTKIEGAKKILISYLPSYILLFVVYTLVLGNFIKVFLQIRNPFSLITIPAILTSLIFAFSVVLFSVYCVKLIKYYLRIKAE